MYRMEPWVWLGGLGISVNYVLFVVALNYTTAGMGGLIVQIQFVALAVMAWIILKEPFHILKAVAAAVVVAGVSLVFLYQRTAADLISSEYAVGNLCMLIAGLGWGVYALSSKAVSRRKTNYEMLIPMFSIAAVVSLAAALIGFESRAEMNGVGILAIVVLGFGVTGGGFLLLSTSLRKLNASVVGGITSVTPLFNLMISHWILGEKLTVSLFVGAFIIIAGILALIRSDRYISSR